MRMRKSVDLNSRPMRNHLGKRHSQVVEYQSQLNAHPNVPRMMKVYYGRSKYSYIGMIFSNHANATRNAIKLWKKYRSNWGKQPNLKQFSFDDSCAFNYTHSINAEAVA